MIRTSIYLDAENSSTLLPDLLPLLLCIAHYITYPNTLTCCRVTLTSLSCTSFIFLYTQETSPFQSRKKPFKE